MRYTYPILCGCAFIAGLCFIVWKEFPFGLLDDAEPQVGAEENITAEALVDLATEMSSMTNMVSEVVNHLIHMEEEHNITLPDSNFTWTSDGSPILSALRNFWAQASLNLLEPLDQESQIMHFDPMDKNTKHVFRAIEHGLLEATTMLISQMEETTVSSLSSREPENIKPKQPEVVKRIGDIVTESPETIKSTEPNVKTKRQNAFDMIANMSMSCSNCYEELNTCVQQCFVQHNCHDIQRGVRACPPVPSRLCNPFTQWNPVDECSTHSDCVSPFLCCSDGCVNKCLQGVWVS